MRIPPLRTFWPQSTSTASRVVPGDAANFIDCHHDFRSHAGHQPMAEYRKWRRLACWGEVDPVSDVDRFVPNYLRLTQAEAEWRAKNPEEDTESYVEKI